MRQTMRSVPAVMHELGAARFVGTYSGAGTLEGGTSGEAIGLKWEQDVRSEVNQKSELI